MTLTFDLQNQLYSSSHHSCMSAKLDEDSDKGSVSIMFIRSKHERQMDTMTDKTTEALPHPLRNMLRWDNNIYIK